MNRKICAIIAVILIPAALFAANSDIRLNSIGYRQYSVKKASISAASVSAFYVCTAPSGPAVLTGTASLFGANGDTGETIWTADFSAVSTPGTYFLSVPGVGNSFSFSIDDNVFSFAFYTVFRGFYLWRCGTAVSGVHNSITYSHAACHLNDGYLDYVGGGHVKKTGTKGWHDAGDYNKYVTNANVSFGVLGKAWEYLRPNIETVTLNLPETAAGYPEYLKELKWETDWLLTMQAPGGRVYHKLSATDFSGDWTMPENNTEDRFFVPYSTAATADFTAMMAQAYRLFLPYDNTYANQCLAAARVSYGRITTSPDNVNVPANQTGFSTGAYGTNDSDDRLWAAAEMWESTGEAVFKNDFESRANSEGDKISDSMDWGDVKNLGMFTYYKSARAGKNSGLMAGIANDTVSRADEYVDAMNGHGYERILGSAYWWGVNGALARASVTLYMANQMSPKIYYVEAGNEILNYLFGRNNFCRSFVTGLGNNPPNYPHDRRSSNDGIAQPWPGYLVGGSPGTNNIGGDVVLASMPPGLPPALYWADDANSFASNEIAINWNSGLVFALAWLKDAPVFPTATVTGTPPTQTVTPTVTQTQTVTPTWTITQTHTITPTQTITPTEVFDRLEIRSHFTYPNPSSGAPVKFRFHNIGYVEKIKIKIFTYSDRKIGEVEKEHFDTGDKNEIIWAPPYKLGNGLYYYILEAQGKNTAVIRKQGAFVILQQFH